MNVILNYITDKNIINSKTISKSFERKMLKTFDFEEYDINISGVLNFIWKKKTYEVVICSERNDKLDRLIYKIFLSKNSAFTFYKNIYSLLAKTNGGE